MKQSPIQVISWSELFSEHNPKFRWTVLGSYWFLWAFSMAMMGLRGVFLMMVVSAIFWLAVEQGRFMRSLHMIERGEEPTFKVGPFVEATKRVSELGAAWEQLIQAVHDTPAGERMEFFVRLQRIASEKVEPHNHIVVAYPDILLLVTAQDIKRAIENRKDDVIKKKAIVRVRAYGPRPAMQQMQAYRYNGSGTGSHPDPGQAQTEEPGSEPLPVSTSRDQPSAEYDGEAADMGAEVGSGTAGEATPGG